MKIQGKLILYEMVLSVGVSVGWYFVRDNFSNVYFLKDVEPLLAGLFVSVIFHSFFLFVKSNTK